MDEKLNKSLIALREAIKGIDRKTLNDIIKKIDNLEDTNSQNISMSKYFKEIDKHFRFYYDFKNVEENNISEFNEENLIENSITSMLYKSMERNIVYHLSLNGENVEHLFDFSNMNNGYEALAA